MNKYKSYMREIEGKIVEVDEGFVETVVVLIALSLIAIEVYLCYAAFRGVN